MICWLVIQESFMQIYVMWWPIRCPLDKEELCWRSLIILQSIFRNSFQCSQSGFSEYDDVDSFIKYWQQGLSKNFHQQKCIPVGCVPAAHWPYAGVCFSGGGGGLLWGGVVPGPRGVCSCWGVPTLVGSAPGGCLLWGVCSWGMPGPGGWHPSMHWGRPPHEQNDRQVQKYYLGHNFVAAGKKQSDLQRELNSQSLV